MMNRSGHSSASSLRRYFCIRLPYSFHDSFSSSRADPDAIRSASLPSISMWPELGVRQQHAVVEHGAADAGAEGDHDHDTALATLPAPKRISATPAASASFIIVTGRPRRLAEQLVGVEADPALVHVGGGVHDAADDDAGERDADRAVDVGEVRHDLLDRRP